MKNHYTWFQDCSYYSLQKHQVIMHLSLTSTVLTLSMSVGSSVVWQLGLVNEYSPIVFVHYITLEESVVGLKEQADVEMLFGRCPAVLALNSP